MIQQIYVTDADKYRLLDLHAGTKGISAMDDSNVEELRREIARARVVSEQKIQGSIITMNSTFLVTFLDSGKTKLLSLVFPKDADFNQGKISILSPLGTALLGFGEGDLVEWIAPAGVKRLKVERVLYQPEAAGHYFL